MTFLPATPDGLKLLAKGLGIKADPADGETESCHVSPHAILIADFSDQQRPEVQFELEAPGTKKDIIFLYFDQYGHLRVEATFTDEHPTKLESFEALDPLWTADFWPDLREKVFAALTA